MPEITFGTVASLLLRIPVIRRFWKDATRGYPVERAVDATAAEYQPALAPLVKTSLYNWFTTDEATTVLRAVGAGGVTPAVSDQLVILFIEHSAIPGVTEEVARRMVVSFVQHLEKALLEQDEKDALWRLERKVTSTIDHQFDGVREDVKQAVVEATTAAGPPYEVDASRDWHQRIDEAKNLADQERWSSALQLLLQIDADANRASDIGPRVRYRLTVNTGACLFALGRPEEARPYFERALDYETDDALALGQLAQIEMDVGDARAAAQYARRAVAKEPISLIGWNVLVQSSVDELTPEAIPQPLRETPLILVARGIIALRYGRTEEGIELFRRALRKGPRDVQTLVVLVESLLVQAVEEHPFCEFTPELRREVIRLSSEAIEQMKEAERPGLLSRALVARGVAMLELDEAAALRDLKRAGELEPESAAQKFNVARALFRQGRADGALYLLDQISDGEHRALVQSLRARALLAMDRLPEVGIAIREAQQASNGAPNELALSLDLADTATRADHLDLAEEILAGVSAEDESRSAVLRGRIAVARGEIDTARTLYETALESALEGDRADVALEFAMQLLRLEDPISAKQYFRIGNASEREDFHRKAFAQSLIESEDWEGAAELLDLMEGEGELADWALDLGGMIGLQRDDFPCAITYLQALLLRRPDVPETRIRLAYALQRRDLSDRSLEVLEPLRDQTDLSARELCRVAQLYSHAGQGADALALSYRSVRLSPDDPEIKRLYVKFFMDRGESDEFDADEIGPDTWVRLIEVGGSRLIEHFIVADRPHMGHPTEIAVTDERGQRLLGKRVDDVVTYHEGRLSETNYRVAEIKSGYVHVFQDVLETFPAKHPDFDGVQAFHIDDSRSLDSFTPIFVSVDRRAAQAEQILAYYSSQGMPLGFVAEQTGCSLRDAYDILAHHQERLLLVERGDEDSRNNSRIAVGQTTPIILTISGLVTLHRIGRLDLLRALGRELLAPPSLLEDLADEIRHLELELERGGSKVMAKVGDQYQFIETPREQVQRRIDEAVSLREFVSEHAQIQPRPLSTVNSASETIRDGIGSSSYDAYALSGPDTCLFADDLGLRTLASNEHGALGFPTSVLLQEASSRGLISRDELFRDMAHLIEMNHGFISVTTDLLYAVLADNGFELNRTVLRPLDRLSPQHANPDSAYGVAASLLRKVALSPVGGVNLEGVTTILCEVLSRGRSARSAVHRLDAAVQQRFALMPLEYQRVRGRMDAFLSSYISRGSIA